MRFGIFEQENAAIVLPTLLEGSERAPDPVDVYPLRPIRRKTEYAIHVLGNCLRGLQLNRWSGIPCVGRRRLSIKLAQKTKRDDKRAPKGWHLDIRQAVFCRLLGRVNGCSKQVIPDAENAAEVLVMVPRISRMVKGVEPRCNEYF